MADSKSQTLFFDALEQYLVVIASCTGTKLKPALEPFLSTVIEKFPQVDFFQSRSDGSKNVPGTIQVVGGGDNRKLIICFAQYYPGKNNLPSDSRELRLSWFKKCLDKIAFRPEVESLAFPNDIATDGGGDWKVYQQTIEDFSHYIKLERPKVKTAIYLTVEPPEVISDEEPVDLIDNSKLNQSSFSKGTKVTMIGLRGLQTTLYNLESMFILDTSDRPLRNTKLGQPLMKLMSVKKTPAPKNLKLKTPKPTPTPEPESSDYIMSDSDEDGTPNCEAVAPDPKPKILKPKVHKKEAESSDYILSDSDENNTPDPKPKTPIKLTKTASSKPSKVKSPKITDETYILSDSDESETESSPKPTLKSVPKSVSSSKPKSVSSSKPIPEFNPNPIAKIPIKPVSTEIRMVPIVAGALPATEIKFDANPHWQGLSSLPVEASWSHFFQDSQLQSELKTLETTFQQEMEDFGDFCAVLPSPPQNIFRAFQDPLDQVRVVILGQDPYHSNLNEAMGLSFSVSAEVPVPPSLKNIFKELKDDLPDRPEPTNGDLSRWAKQGVLLLNTSLTVRHKKPGVHLTYWQKFTDRVIELLAQDTKHPRVFLLWGNPAQKKASLISKHNRILKAVHPSPLSANRGGWFGSKHFSQTNQILTEWGLTPIEW